MKVFIIVMERGENIKNVDYKMEKEKLLQLLESVLLLSDGTSQFDLIWKKGIDINIVIFANKLLHNLENETMSTLRI